MVVVDPAVLFQPICLSLYSYFYFHYCHRWSILYGLYGRWSFLTEFVSRWLRSNSGADAFNNGFQWNSYRWQVNNKTTCSFWLNSMEKKWCTSTVSQVLLRAWMIVFRSQNYRGIFPFVHQLFQLTIHDGWASFMVGNYIK